MPKKKKAKKRATKKQSASAFIRSQDPRLRAAAVVAAGKKKGISFTPGLVYIVRGRMQPKKAKLKLTASQKVSKRALPKTTYKTPDPEAVFRRLIARLGLDRARRLVDEFDEEFPS